MQTIPSPDARQILVLEDDRDLSQLVQMHLRDAGYSYEVSHDGAAGLAQMETRNYDLIVLDLTLPRTDGLEVCRQVRAQSRYTPIIMVTSRGDELGRVLGLELGADDYLAKPFSMRELKRDRAPDGAQSRHRNLYHRRAGTRAGVFGPRRQIAGREH